MKLRALICFSALWFGAALSAQTTSSPVAPPLPPALAVSSDSEALTHFGLRYADFEEVNITLVKTALEDPTIIAFSAEVEAMIAKRDDMIAAAACKKNPKLAGKILKMHQKMSELKQRGAKRAEELRQGKPAQSEKPQG